MHGCMDAWMHAWMHGCMDAWMHGCMDAWMDAWMHGCMDGCMDAWMHGCMDARMHGCTDGWQEEPARGRTLEEILGVRIGGPQRVGVYACAFSATKRTTRKHRHQHSMNAHKRISQLAYAQAFTHAHI